MTEGTATTTPTLRDLRVAKALTQEQLGRLVGCTRQQISILELGGQRDSTGRMLNALARALEVSRDEIEAAILQSVKAA